MSKSTGIKLLQDDIFSDDPYSNDSDMIQNDEEFNSSQVPEVTENYIQRLIEEIPKPTVQKPIQPGAGLPGKDAKSKNGKSGDADSVQAAVDNHHEPDSQGRFLCWNNTGIIRAQYGSDDQSVDVMFHDTEKHTSVNFKNEPNYSFGSMSDDVIVLGSNGKWGSGPATLHGINLLEPNPDKREWELNLPYVELIEALAAGQGFVAVATDQRNLRLVTYGGMQSFILTLPGQILCMSAYERQLMIIYHNGAGLPADQNLGMILYNVDLLNVKIDQTLGPTPVGLGKRDQLAWAGFSDEGTPCTYDYQGTLRIYRADLGNSWVPVLNLKELTSSALNNYYVVGLSEFTQKVRAVQCFESRVPPLDTESPQLLDFSLPLCNMDTDKGQLEEEQVRLRMAILSYQRPRQEDIFSRLSQTNKEAKEKALVNTILRLFALYLREDKEELAKNLVFLMPKDHVSKLPEYAWKTKRRQHFIDSLNLAIDEREHLLSSLDSMSDFSMSKDISTNGTYKL